MSPEGVISDEMYPLEGDKNGIDIETENNNARLHGKTSHNHTLVVLAAMSSFRI